MGATDSRQGLVVVGKTAPGMGDANKDMPVFSQKQRNRHPQGKAAAGQVTWVKKTTLHSTYAYLPSGTLPFPLSSWSPCAFAQQSPAAGAAAAGCLRVHALTAMDDFIIATNRTRHTAGCTRRQYASACHRAGVASSAVQRSRCRPLSRATGGLRHTWPTDWPHGIYQPD